jgi:hypothetical protein
MPNALGKSGKGTVIVLPEHVLKKFVKQDIFMTLRFAALAALFSLSSIGTALATPQEDATYIVQQTASAAILEGVFVATRPVLLASIQNNLNALGIELDDPDRFFDIFIEEFTMAFLEEFHDDLIELYLAEFTPEQLAAMVVFYKSDTGQVLLFKTPSLMAAQAQIGAQTGQRAGRAVGPRVQARLEEEGLRIAKDPSVLGRLKSMLSGN